MANDLSRKPKANYRRCVGIFLLNPRGQVFVGRRSDMSADAWQMPQGGIDKDEDIVEAAQREMLEEIGTNRATLLEKSAWWRSYALPKELAKRMWRGKYLGQTQIWCAFRFDGKDADIDLDYHEPEFSAWRWVDADDLVELIVPFKRDVYISVVDEFRHLWA